MVQTVRDENNQIHEFPDDATPQEMNAALGSSVVSQPQEKPGLLQRAADLSDEYLTKPKERFLVNPANAFASNFMTSLGNIVPGALNLPIKFANYATGSQIPEIPRLQAAEHPDDWPSNLAAGAGEAASYLAPGNIFKMMSRIPELEGAAHSALKIPLIAAGVKHAINAFSKSPMTSKIAGNAVLGGAYSPDHPVAGMALGGAAPVVGKYMEPIASAIESGAKKIINLPNAIAKVNPKEVAQSIQSSHDTLKKEAVNLFDEVGEKANKLGVNIIPRVNELVENVAEYLPKTRAAKSLIDKAITGEYESLRKLQSELFDRGTKKSYSTLSSERDAGEEMLDLRDRINESISKHFKNTGNHELVDLLNAGKKKYYQLKKTYFGKKTPVAIKNLVHEESRKIPKNMMNVLNEESTPMQRIKQHNPIAAKASELSLKKKNAMNDAKNLGIGGGILAGASSLPYIYSKAKSLFDNSP